MRPNARVAVALALVCLVAGAAFGAFGRRAHEQEPALPDWITIAEQRCGGLTRSEVLRRLVSWHDQEVQRRFTVIVSPPGEPRRMWTVPRGSLGAEPDTDRMVDEAYRIAEAEGWWDRVGRWFGRGDPVDVKPLWRVSEDAVAAFLRREVARQVDRPTMNARLKLRGGATTVIPDRTGLKLDVPASIARLRETLADPVAESVELPLVSVVPAVTAADAVRIRHELASFSTHFSERGNRKTNLQVACARIDGVIIKPGGVFSYNEVVGPREAENGFRIAPVIVRGRMEPGMGGGVCQVSTTVYNAALLAGLEILVRSHHAFPVHYVPAGRDATVVYGSTDLKIKNSTRGPVAFFADADDGRVRVRILGSEPKPWAVSLERSGIASWAPDTKVLRDPRLPTGKRVVQETGRPGHRVSVWRVFRRNGRVVRRELISRDVYRSFPRIVVVGAAAPSQPTAPRPQGRDMSSSVPGTADP